MSLLNLQNVFPFNWLVKLDKISMFNDKFSSQYTIRSFFKLSNKKKSMCLEHLPFRCIDSMRGRSSGWMQVSSDEPIKSWGRYPSNGTALKGRRHQISFTNTILKAQCKRWSCARACVYWPVVHFQEHTARGVSGGEDALVQGDPRCCTNK